MKFDDVINLWVVRSRCLGNYSHVHVHGVNLGDTHMQLL